MPFGKHCGEDIADIPTGYLRWLRDNTDLYGELADEVEAELDRRLFNQRQESSQQSDSTFFKPFLREVVEHGYKAAARVHHPDAGGSVATMQRLNALVQFLRTQLDKMESPV
jgi:hypothetical protein